MRVLGSPIVVRPKYDIRSLGDAPHPFRLLSGWAAQYHDGYDGERQTLGIMLPGDVWYGTSSFGIVALTECHVDYAVNGIDVNRIDGGIDDLATVQGLLIAIGNLDAAGRVAFVIQRLFDRLDRIGMVDDQSATIPITQSEIASLCCITPVHVNRTLRRLDNDGIIRREGKRLKILRTHALARLARTDLTRRAPTGLIHSEISDM